MSANILTMLKEFESGKYPLETVKHAIGHTDAGDTMDYNDWRVIYTCKDDAEMIADVKKMLPKYHNVFDFLGSPATAQEWQVARSKVIRNPKKSAEYHLIINEELFDFSRIFRL